MTTTLPIATLPSPVDPSAAAAEARSVLDVQGLDALKAASAQTPNDPKVLRAVAQQFESLFIGMMLKSMRDAKLGDGLFDSDQSRLYQDMFDQQLSVSLSQGRGLGIADLLVRSLSPPVPPAGLPPGAYGKITRRSTAPAAAAAVLGTGAAVDAVKPEAAEAPPAVPPGEGALSQTPEEFVALVMPSATAAGSALGVDPLALVAQAALESNWGRQVPAADSGSSYNVFGIKADAGWSGRRALKDTIEYSGGVAERRREPFRAYDSLAHGFEDYVAFLSNHDRYAGALQQGADPEGFAAALQTAGYATDPAYSTKIAAVMRSSQFRNAVAALKDSDSAPIF